MNGFKTISSIFDDAIYNLFGFPFEDIFNSDSASNYTYQKKSITRDGDTYTVITKDGDTKCLKNGKRISLSDIPPYIVDHLKSVNPISVNPRLWIPAGCNNKLPEPIVSGTEFPYCDVICKEDKSLLLRFALAGISQDRVSIDFDDDYLTVKIAEKAEDNDSAKHAFLQRGIKGTDGEYYKNIFIDPKKYDIDSLGYEFKDGMLLITIQKSEKASTKKIFLEAAKKQEEKKESGKVEE